MTRDPATIERLRLLLTQVQSMTKNRKLHWERQVDSAHRYARWNNNLLILGPAAPLTDTHIPRYLFITPFDSPDHIEINSEDPDFGPEIIKLVATVEVATRNEPATDPFEITGNVLDRLTNQSS